MYSGSANRKADTGITAIAVIVSLFQVACSGTGNNNAQKTTGKNRSAGAELLFEKNCAACHGSDGTAGITGAANLRVSKTGDTAVLQMINEGNNGMPAFKSRLCEKEIQQLAEYVHSLRR